MRTVIATAALLLLFAEHAQAKETVPVPRQKPAVRRSVQDVIPIPRLNPRRDGVVTAGTPPAVEIGWPAAVVAAERQRCGQLLKGLDLRYKPLPPLGSATGCGAPAPIEISAVAGAALDPPATTTCDMGYGLSRWISASVQPAAQRLLNTGVTVIRTASSYVCRGRNGMKGGKLSEHGKANALDMSGFTFARSKAVTVGDGWGGLLHGIGLSPGGSFLSAIRADACGMTSCFGAEIRAS